MNLEARKPGMGLGNYELSERVIAAAIRVHKELGPGFLESMYEEALAIELAHSGILFERQKLLPIFYREHVIGEHRLDLLVEGKLILELKAIEQLLPVHEAQLMTYFRLTGKPIGLLINFNVSTLRKGIIRRVL